MIDLMGNFLIIRPPKFNKLYLLSYIVRIITMKPNLKAVRMFQIKPGTRVVRGPDWASKKQDNGEGFLGTIIFVPKAGSSDNQVTVIWDSGRELRYRAGHNGKYDLRVYDCAPAGKSFPSKHLSLPLY